MKYRVAVVGSGPSGVTAARRLTAAGINVDMFDVGTDSNFEIKGIKPVSGKGLMPKKTLFGSTYMYCRRDGMHISASDNVSFDTSHAKGGLSSVWGATLCAVRAHDIADWPVSFEDLSYHLNHIFEDMQLSVRVDMIDSIYNIKLNGNDLKYENIQSEFILKMVELNAIELLNKNIIIGKSKLAIDNIAGSANSCVLCGQCMIGCERGAIFNSWKVVELLLKNSNFRYFDNHLVKHFKECGNIVEINVHDLNNGTILKKTYDSIILAAGCIDSTKIVDSSLGWTGHEYIIRDSQKYYFPIWVNKSGWSCSDKTISLAHLYVQIFDSKNNIVQGQLYPGKYIAIKVLEHIFGGLGRIIGLLVSPFLKRLFVGMVYFSSAVSGSILIRFSNDNQMCAKGIMNKSSDGEFITFIKKLIKERKLIGFSPIFNLRIRSKLGHSQHFGGTIPMRASPVIYESDALGRPFGCKNVYVVDSTVLTSVPATPTTGLIMANSDRIVSSLIEILKKRV